MNNWDNCNRLLDSLEKNSHSFSFLSELMIQLRQAKIQRSDVVVKYGPKILKSISDTVES